MKKLFALATLLIATTTAQAGDSFSFRIGGQSVHIDAPSNCASTSCISVSIPGVYEYGPKRARRSRDTEQADHEVSLSAQPSPPAAQAAPQPVAHAPQSLEPANGPPASSGSTSAPPSATASVAPAAPEPAAQPAIRPDRDAAPASSPAPAVVAAAPVAPAVQQQQTQPARPVLTEASPIGIWMTEKKEGKVRIEACGNNLCGYSVNARSNANGDKVLINMKPGSNKWTGRIYDPNSGSTYDSTIALKGPDSLRVQGCAFGGMFCGGQTWSRVN